ncbi:hypothetical protein [Prochlorococcus sp. MIT 1341]|uniref:hypothetical protein n=1 Tax=Prochlorococcus sp. MIT 1341 TaxID=3096221 RepID=UPI002A747A2D|nr:hypothetical protein [Prochlorococcus sp. MIT 1341]
MSGSKQTKAGGFQSDQEGGQLAQPTQGDDSEEVNLESRSQSPKGMKFEIEGSRAKNKKQQGSQANDKKQVDIDEYSLGGIKYRIPGKRQRIVVASVVLGLNLLLVLAVILYFNNPNFQNFIYHVGRNV